MRTQDTEYGFQGARASLWRQPLAWLNVSVLVLLVTGYSNADQAQSDQIAALEARVRKLEMRVETVAHQVVAPFAIVDSQGKRIMNVDAAPYRGFRLYNEQGSSVAEMALRLGGTVLELGSDNSKVKASLGAVEKDAAVAALYFKTDNKMRALITTGTGGHASIALTAQDGIGLAAALESQPDWTGRISVFNKQHLPVAYIAESEKHPGGGNVIMADPDGNKVFTAGFIGDGNGAACVLRKGSGDCLGLRIPGMLGAP